LLSKEAEGSDHNSWIEGVAILMAVLIVATVTATNDYLKDKQFRALKSSTTDRGVFSVTDSNRN
jgi:hypothetical protein